MLKSGEEKIPSMLKDYADTFPDYLPFTYLYMQSSNHYRSENDKVEFPEHLHLKNFYPGRIEFCIEEASLYINTLIVFFGMTDEIVKLIALSAIIEDSYPELMPPNEMIIAKFLMVPPVMMWCVAAVKE